MSEKILVAAPIYNLMDYCLENFIKSLKQIDHDNYDILLVDNSRENNFFERLKNIDEILVIKDDTNEEKNKLRLISSRNKIIDYALENNYNYILMMDADVIPPRNILRKLLEDKKDIVSGLYYNYFIVDGNQKLNPVCWCDLPDEVFEEIKRKFNLPDIVKSKMDLRRFLTEEEANSNETLEVKIPSAGCMLIKKNVFERIRYGLLDLPKNISTGDDIYFCFEARKNGFKIYCNTSVKCEHLIFGKLYKDSEGNLKNPLHD